MRRLRFLSTCFFASFTLLTGEVSTKAQLMPDQTLGAESSTVFDEDFNGVPTRFIEGGATRGANLFHSFLEFNVNTDEQVYFESPAGIDSIFSRITGGSTSTINGVLGTIGSSDAALILMNPNGILFEERATLDVQGAFTATTATEIRLEDTGTFSAIDTRSDRLLSIQPSAFFFNSLTNSGNISITGADIEVPNSQSLLLLGRNVFIDEGRLFASGGKVSIGAMSETGTVDISSGSLIFPEAIQQGLIRLENNAQIDVRLANSGEITLTAGDIDILSGSALLTGILFGLDRADSPAGTMTLAATGLITVSGDQTQLSSEIQELATGNASDININANRIQIVDGAEVRTATFGRGGAGNISIFSQDSTRLDSVDINSSTSSPAGAQGGDVVIEASSLTVANDTSISSNTFSSGNSGNVMIRAARNISFESGAARSLVGENAAGQGGDVQIFAESLSLTDSSSLNSSTFGKGRGGSVVVQVARDVLFDGSDSLSLIGDTADGLGGDIRITAGSLLAKNGAGFSSSSFGIGEAGNVVIQAKGAALFNNSSVFSVIEPAAEGQGGDVQVTANSLMMTNGSSLEASSAGRGDAGNVVVRAKGDVLFADSFASSVLEEGAEGQGGDVQVSARSLSLADRASLNSSTFGKGNAGDVVIQAGDTARLNRSAVFSTIGETAAGAGGDVLITAGSFSAVNDSTLSSSTAGQGEAGDVVIQARGDVLLDQSGVFSAVDNGAVGAGGDIRAIASNVFLNEKATLSANSNGAGNAGNISVTVRDRLQAKDSTIATDSNFNAGGQIEIGAEEIILQGDSDIQTFVSSSESGGGDITVEANALVILDDSDIFSFSQDGAGGDIDLQQTALFSRPLNPISDGITRAEIDALEGNDSVDINATGATASGKISTNDNVLIDNDLVSLPDNLVSSESLVASSCVNRDNRDGGTFTLTGRDRPSQSPTAPFSTPYATGTVQTVSPPASAAVQEPESVYLLANGRFIISHRCEE